MHRKHLHQKAHPSKKAIIQVSFMYVGDAQAVSVIGDFNNWDPAAHPMKQHVDGAWRIQIPIPHGHHQYLFLVDGKPVLDPQSNGIARNEKNEKVSVLAVS
jgi:1,4-alpha-glucan branching enzyme